MRHRSSALLGLFVIAFLALSPGKADSAAAGMSARDEALANFAAFMSEPPAVDIIATLAAPVTTYELRVAEEWSAQYAAMAKALSDVGVRLGESGPAFGEFRWTGEVSCGRLGRPDYLEFRWSHPDGPPPDCPHEQGTDHPGIITADNLHFRFALREAIVEDDKFPTNEAFKKMDDAPRIAEYLWTLNCRYADGSKSGRARCTGTLQTGQDGAGGGTAANADGQGKKGGAGAAGAAAGAAVAVGAASYWWWRRPFDWQEVQRGWKMKKEDK